MKWPFQIVAAMLISVATVGNAQLEVTVSPPKVVGQKAVIPLALRNGLSENVRSARAVVFLVDEQGKMVAQSTRWIIGGEPSRPRLAAGATNSYFFVVAHDRPFSTTNLTAKLNISRVVLEGGKLVDLSKHVSVTLVKP